MTEIRELAAYAAITAIVICQLPAAGIVYAWITLGQPIENINGGLLLIGFFAPAFMLAGWLIAVPTLIVSPLARRNPLVWLALLLGSCGILPHERAIGRF